MRQVIHHVISPVTDVPCTLSLYVCIEDTSEARRQGTLNPYKLHVPAVLQTTSVMYEKPKE